MRVRTHIKAALLELDFGRQVRVYREDFEEGHVDGFLVGLGREWFALHVVSSSVHLDGFSCMRYADVTELHAPPPFGGLTDKVLVKRGEQVAGELSMKLDSVQALLESVPRKHRLVTVYLEEIDPDVCYVGEVLGFEDGNLVLRYINPAGVWSDDLDHYSLTDLTRVDFGGGYLEALEMVGYDDEG